MTKKFGIDISRWDKGLDLKKAKETDKIEYVIIKAGGGDGGLYQDSQFTNFYNQAKDMKLPKGAYFFGQALDKATAINEAKKFASIVKGLSFEYPLFYDVEAKMLEAKDLTNVVLAFINQMKSAGYKNLGVYASASPFRSKLDAKKLKEAGCVLWVASYSKTKPSIGGLDYDIWQFGGETNYIRDKYICGINVDQNYCYTDITLKEDKVVTESAPVTKPSTSTTTTKPSTSTSTTTTKFKVGDKVKVLKAVQYDNNKAFNVYHSEYVVKSISKDRVVIGYGDEITAAVKDTNLAKVTTTSTTTKPSTSTSTTTAKFKVGDKVKVLKAVQYDNNKAFNLYHSEYVVKSISKDRVVIGYGDEITAAVKDTNLAKVTTTSTTTSKPTTSTTTKPSTSTSTSTTFKKGDKVKVLKAVQYNGKPFTLYHSTYTVLSVDKDRVVIGVNNVITAAVKSSNLKKA